MSAFVERQNVLIDRMTLISNRLQDIQNRMWPTSGTEVYEVSEQPDASPQGYVGCLSTNADELDSLAEKMSSVLNEIEKLL